MTFAEFHEALLNRFGGTWCSNGLEKHRDVRDTFRWAAKIHGACGGLEIIVLVEVREPASPINASTVVVQIFAEGHTDAENHIPIIDWGAELDPNRNPVEIVEEAIQQMYLHATWMRDMCGDIEALLKNEQSRAAP